MRLAVAALAAAVACLAQVPAWGQALYPCSQTVSTAAAPVAFGTRAPLKYLEICNAHATNGLGVNATGSVAVIGGAGTRTLTAGQCAVWTLSPPPTDVSIIGSAASTTTACGFR